MTNPALVADYRIARAAQDARFDSRPGAGAVDHTMTGTEEYRAYFGLGEFHGYGVEVRVTFREFLIQRAAERRAEREAAEREARAELVAAAPTHFLAELADDADAGAELDRRLAEWDAANAYDVEPVDDAQVDDVDAELAELVELAAVEPVRIRPAVRVAACRPAVRQRTNACANVYTSANLAASTATVTREEPAMSKTTAAEPVAANREAWLNAAVDKLRPLFEQLAGVELPARVNVSCGFPGGRSIHKVIGQCWSTASSADELAQVFVSPMLHEPVDVLAVLAHELVHAWDNCEHGHKAPFARVAKAIGLTGKMTATVAGDELRETLDAIAAELGAYPHAGMRTAVASVKKQGTRMLKVECPACGYVVRTTAKWLEIGTPTCVCGEQMEAAA